MKTKRLCLLALAGLCAHALTAAEPIKLFNGRDLDGWEVFTVETKHENPGVFTVERGMLKVAGGKGAVAYFGGLITKREYSNYKLTFAYKWGGPTYGEHKGRARDSGVLLHCIGPVEPGPWMTSCEFQIIEGGTGDLILINAVQRYKQNIPPVTVKLAAEGRQDGNQFVFQAGAQKLEFVDKGRLNWSGRDPQWKNQTGFRGRQDVESPFGEWTKCEIVTRGDTLAYSVNGRLVNQASGLSVTRGRIFLQTEGAEVFYRDIELTPLD